MPLPLNDRVNSCTYLNGEGARAHSTFWTSFNNIVVTLIVFSCMSLPSLVTVGDSSGHIVTHYEDICWLGAFVHPVEPPSYFIDVVST